MSRTLSMNSGSFDSLKVLTRCGCNANARQIRLTAVWLNPHRRAIARVLQWVASRGVLSSVNRITRSTSASPIFRGAPGRGSSSSPANRCCAKRWRQRPTVWGATPAALAISPFVCSKAHANTMRARCASACAVVGRRAHCSSVSRSSVVKITGGVGRPIRIGVLRVYTKNVPTRQFVP
jgi:hypothetical protein